MNYSIVYNIYYKSGQAKVCVNVVYLCGLCVHVNNVILCGDTVRNVVVGP